jgi:prepilin-type N-terminal cleavage/methylation domain-containing protein
MSALPGFTLIELLVVIAVIALLAGMIFPVTGVVNKIKIRSKARAELARIELAIDGYKSKLGYLPPGNSTNYALSPLYYELAGTSRQGMTFETLDKSSTIIVGDLLLFGVTGFMNSMVGSGGDEGPVSQRFLTGARPAPTAAIGTGADTSQLPKVLITSIPWNVDKFGVLFPQNPAVSPVFYNPTNPTNNPTSYDLWVDVTVGDKTNRISNWSREPIIL